LGRTFIYSDVSNLQTYVYILSNKVVKDPVFTGILRSSSFIFENCFITFFYPPPIYNQCYPVQRSLRPLPKSKVNWFWFSAISKVAYRQWFLSNSCRKLFVWYICINLTLRCIYEFQHANGTYRLTGKVSEPYSIGASLWYPSTLELKSIKSTKFPTSVDRYSRWKIIKNSSGWISNDNLQFQRINGYSCARKTHDIDILIVDILWHFNCWVTFLIITEFL
jgi:hypothetical protein